MKLVEGRWSIHHKCCLECGTTDHKHEMRGMCVECVKKFGSYWTLRDHRIKQEMEEERGDLKRWQPLSDKWIGKTQEGYDGIEYKCDGCPLSCEIKSPFKNPADNSIQFQKFRAQYIIECQKKI